jgi:hypothetical protein
MFDFFIVLHNAFATSKSKRKLALEKNLFSFLQAKANQKFQALYKIR